MSCQEMREFLDAYVDRELDVATTLQFERHLTDCVDCREICEQYQQFHNSVSSRIPYYQAPPELGDKVRAMLRPTVEERFPRWRGWAIAAGLAGLLIFGAALFRLMIPAPESQMLAEQVVSSHIRSLMANHLSDVVSTDQHTVKPWFSGKLDFAPVVKDLAPKGFPLVGGRLDYINNHSAAALVYKRRQHTINLFLWPSSESDSSPRSITIKGFNVVEWTHSHMAYWAVSDLNADELTEFAHDLEQ
jgi:anti-sigma factor RsiW